MTITILWLIGWQFSCGYMGTQEMKNRKGFLCSAILFLSWPLILGCWLRDHQVTR